VLPATIAAENLHFIRPYTSVLTAITVFTFNRHSFGTSLCNTSFSVPYILLCYVVVYVHEAVGAMKDDRVKFLLVGHKDCFVVTPLIHVAAV
jgi:hypothetical protein